MKKLLIPLFLLAGVLLLLPSELPAPTLCYSITKSCTDAAEPGAPTPFSGTVTNCGWTNLSDVTVVDDNGTPGDASDDFTVFGPQNLPLGTSANYSGSYYPAGSPSTYAAQTFGDLPRSDGRRLQIGWFQTETKGMLV